METYELLVVLTLAATGANAQSWQSYVDKNLVGSGHVKAAIIVGLNGSTLASKNLQLKPGEGEGIVGLYGIPDSAYALGISVAGVLYRPRKVNPRSIYGERDATGVVLVKTTKAIIIGQYDEKQMPLNAEATVEKLGDKLIKDGF